MYTSFIYANHLAFIFSDRPQIHKLIDTYRGKTIATVSYIGEYIFWR